MTRVQLHERQEETADWSRMFRLAIFWPVPVWGTSHSANPVSLVSNKSAPAEDFHEASPTCSSMITKEVRGLKTDSNKVGGPYHDKPCKMFFCLCLTCFSAVCFSVCLPSDTCLDNACILVLPLSFFCWQRKGRNSNQIKSNQIKSNQRPRWSAWDKRASACHGLQGWGVREPAPRETKHPWGRPENRRAGSGKRGIGGHQMGAWWTEECVQHHVQGHPAGDAEPGLESLLTSLCRCQLLHHSAQCPRPQQGTSGAPAPPETVLLSPTTVPQPQGRI